MGSTLLKSNRTWREGQLCNNHGHLSGACLVIFYVQQCVYGCQTVNVKLALKMAFVATVCSLSHILQSCQSNEGKQNGRHTVYIEQHFFSTKVNQVIVFEYSK